MSGEGGITKDAAVATMHYVEGWLSGAGHEQASRYLRDRVNEVADAMVADECATDVNPVSGEGGLVEVQAAHGSVSGALIRRDGRLGVLCRCDHFMPADDWRDTPAMHAEHVAAAVREWMAGVLDEHEADCPSPDCPRHAGPLFCLPCSEAVVEWVPWQDHLRDRLGITGGGQ